MKWVRVARCADLRADEPYGFDCDGTKVAAFRVDGEFFAIQATCPHRDGPLDEGFVEGNVVTCPWHGWNFDVTTGISPDMPAARVKTHRTRVDGDDLAIEIDD